MAEEERLREAVRSPFFGTEQPASGDPSLEFQREIDAIQAVYLEERRQLEMQIRGINDEMLALCGHLWPSAHILAEEDGIADDAPLDMLPPEEGSNGLARRRVRWHLKNTEALCRSAVSSGYCARECFRLLECPGVNFVLTFRPFEDDVTDAEFPLPCKLEFHVSGAATEGLRLSVGLSICAESPATCARESSECRYVLTELASISDELLGADNAVCDVFLPSPVPAIVCQVALAVLSWDAEVLRFETQSKLDKCLEDASSDEG